MLGAYSNELCLWEAVCDTYLKFASTLAHRALAGLCGSEWEIVLNKLERGDKDRMENSCGGCENFHEKSSIQEIQKGRIHNFLYGLKSAMWS